MAAFKKPLKSCEQWNLLMSIWTISFFKRNICKIEIIKKSFKCLSCTLQHFYRPPYQQTKLVFVGLVYFINLFKMQGHSWLAYFDASNEDVAETGNTRNRKRRILQIHSSNGLQFPTLNKQDQFQNCCKDWCIIHIAHLCV